MSALCLRRLPAAIAFTGAAAALIIPLLPLCAAAAPPAPTVQRRTLSSGIRVIIAEQAGTKLAALDLRVRVGSGAETPSANGTAHFIEHLLFKGTGTRKPGEIDLAIERLGGELKAQTTRDATRFAAVLPAENWRGALSVIAEMTLHPAFRPGDVAAEKSVILSEMAIARTDPMRAGFDALAGIAFDGEDAYRLPLMGSEANVRAMTSEALRTFWQRWYRPENMTLVIAGDVRAAEVVEEVERLFPSIPLTIRSKTEGEERKPAAPVTGARTTIRDAGGEEVTTIFAGFRAPSAGSRDAAAIVAGLVSLLAERSDAGSVQGKLKDSLVARQHLALSVTADYVAQRGQSLVVFSVTVLRSNAAKLENALLAEFDKLPGTGFTNDDAAQARRNLLQAQASNGSVEDTAARLARADVLGLSEEETDDPERYAARLLRVVTPESLAAAAGEYLSTNRGSIVVIEPPVTTELPVVP